MPAIATSRADAPAPLDPSLCLPIPRRADEARAYRVADGLWALRLPVPFRQTPSVTCHLLAVRDGWLLVDCGPSAGPGWAALERALRLAGVEPAAIAGLVLTHLHPDHAALAGDVVGRLGCPLLRLDAPDVAWDRHREPTGPRAEREAALMEAGVPAADRSVMLDVLLGGEDAADRPPADRLLAPGDALPTHTGTWEVVPAQGHSSNQLVLWNAERGWMLSADLAYPIKPFLEWGHIEDPCGAHLGSIERAAALGPTLLLPSHGRPVDRVAAQFDGARDGTQRLIGDVLERLDDRPRSAYEVTCDLAGHDPHPDTRQSMLGKTLCCLEHLVARDAVRAVDDGDGVRRFAR